MSNTIIENTQMGDIYCYQQLKNYSLCSQRSSFDDTKLTVAIFANLYGIYRRLAALLMPSLGRFLTEVIYYQQKSQKTTLISCIC